MFIFKETNTDDRDCVNYIERPTFDCGHYFGGINLKGACFSMSLKFPKNIKTILTKEERVQLLNYNVEINKLGYDIKGGSQKYKKGLKLLEEIENVFKKLEGEENTKLFKEVQEEEREYLSEEHQLTEKDIDDIFNQYYLEYRDRGCLGAIYRDKDQMGMELVDVYCLDIPEGMKQYFNYEEFADDLLNDDNYIELDCGQCVSLNY